MENVSVNTEKLDSREEVVSVKDWLISMVVMMIPFVNIVMMFVWAFADGTNKSKSNFFKASLIISLICIVLSIILSGVIIGLVVSLANSGMNYY